MRRDEMTLAQKLEADKFTFHIITNPPVLELRLGITKVERKTITAYGISRKDAMERAGIQ